MFFLVVIIEAPYRGQVVVVFALGARFVRRLLAGVLLDVFYCRNETPVSNPVLSDTRGDRRENTPLTFVS